MCIYIVQNPNALDSKVLVDFDHIKKSLTIDDEGDYRLILPIMKWATETVSAVIFKLAISLCRTEENGVRSII